MLLQQLDVTVAAGVSSFTSSFTFVLQQAAGADSAGLSAALLPQQLLCFTCERLPPIDCAAVIGLNIDPELTDSALIAVIFTLAFCIVLVVVLPIDVVSVLASALASELAVDLDPQHDDTGLALADESVAVFALADVDAGIPSSSSRPTNKPATIALVIAAIGRTIAIKGPSNTYDTVIESTPVSGVDTKKEVVAALEAPARRKPTAAGITPHEHKGKGAPNNAALTTVFIPWPPSCFCIHAIGTNTFSNPASTKPSNNHGADSKNK